jgi:hypothetical protein
MHRGNPGGALNCASCTHLIWIHSLENVHSSAHSKLPIAPQQRTSTNAHPLMHNHKSQRMISSWYSSLESKHSIRRDNAWFEVKGAPRQFVDAPLRTCVVSLPCAYFAVHARMTFKSKVPPITDVCTFYRLQAQWLSLWCTKVTDCMPATQLPISARPSFQHS